jgi:hypothetical protein
MLKTMINNAKLKVVMLLIPFLILAFYILITITDIDFVERSDKENAARILRWNLRRCGEISRIGREYGEGSLTIMCTTGHAYLLSASEHCDNPLRVYCWEIRDLDPDALNLK